MDSIDTKMNSHGTGAILHNYWQDAKVRALCQIVFLVGMGALAAFGKSIHPSIGVPGSSAVYWLTPMIVGKVFVKKAGSGLLMGSCVGAFSLSMGLNHSVIYNLGLYGGTGLLLDAGAALPKVKITSILGTMFCGMLAHMAKFGYIMVAASLASTTKRFILFGVLKSASLHAAFGLAAGIIGWLIYYIWQQSHELNANK